MQIRTMELGVGAFMLSGILALAFLALKVSGLSVHDSTTDTYKLYAHCNNVVGLTSGAQVTVAGVLIRRVDTNNQHRACQHRWKKG